MKIYSMSETAELLGNVPENSFSFWQRKGWLPPPKKSEPYGRLTYYTDKDLKKLRVLVKKLRASKGKSKKRTFGPKELTLYT